MEGELEGEGLGIDGELEGDGLGIDGEDVWLGDDVGGVGGEDEVGGDVDGGMGGAVLCCCDSQACKSSAIQPTCVMRMILFIAVSQTLDDFVASKLKFN